MPCILHHPTQQETWVVTKDVNILQQYNKCLNEKKNGFR
jgi:hypothetical protein